MFVLSFDLAIRFLSLLVFVFWWLYWKIAAFEAEKEKPKTTRQADNVRWWVLRIIELLVVVQLLGVQILPIPNANLLIQIVGAIFIGVGVGVSIVSRMQLGSNWAHAMEFQIKQKQELITAGIYKSIRHPIYSGLLLAFLGAELVAKSYLVFLTIIVFVGVYLQVQREEQLLLKHFGDKYKKYMTASKRFIPFVI